VLFIDFFAALIFNPHRTYLSVFIAQILPYISVSVHLKVSKHFVFDNALSTSFETLLQKLYFQIQTQEHSCHRTGWSRLVLARRLVRISVWNWLTEIFGDFPQSLSVKWPSNTSIGSRRLPSVSFPIHDASTILSACSMYSWYWRILPLAVQGLSLMRKLGFRNFASSFAEADTAFRHTFQFPSSDWKRYRRRMLTDTSVNAWRDWRKRQNYKEVGVRFSKRQLWRVRRAVY
jgi:hypothetical protein